MKEFTDADIWHMRHFYEMLSLWFQVRDPLDPVSAHRPQEAYKERRRIARRAAWVSETSAPRSDG